MTNEFFSIGFVMEYMNVSKCIKIFENIKIKFKVFWTNLKIIWNYIQRTKNYKVHKMDNVRTNLELKIEFRIIIIFES